jgi:aspartyl/asparaginyl beta-hydroxylase (cupin superfamily)
MNKLKDNKVVHYFYNIDKFPQFKLLESNYEIILEELKEVVQKQNRKKDLFEPWIEKNLYQESNDEGWDVAPLMIAGVKIKERCVNFPKLIELTDQMEGIMSISFSLLKPGTHIVPHKGYDDYSEKVYRYHLGLIVPKGDIGIRVEKEIRGWEVGKSFIFDDYMVHEAWNFTNEERVVLIMDFLKDINNPVSFDDANFAKASTPYLK